MSSDKLDASSVAPAGGEPLKDVHVESLGEQVDKLADKVDRTFGQHYKKEETPVRPMVTTKTGKGDNFYCMSHGRRGDCLIFVHENYAPSIRLHRRDSADHDARLCRKAFQFLGFEVQVYKDLRLAKFNEKLEEASNKDHSECDALVVVFMSHGDNKDGQEVIFAKDDYMKTDELWKPFLGNKCTTLAGKPKLFFIQACRGDKLDHGVGVKVSTDALSIKKKEPSYVIPGHADLMVMWASYPGMFAFKSTREGIKGSVFIHYLAKTILEESDEDQDFSGLLVKVTRQVATQYESHCPNQNLDKNKQVPHTSTTLTRSIVFTPLK